MNKYSQRMFKIYTKATLVHKHLQKYDYGISRCRNYININHRKLKDVNRIVDGHQLPPSQMLKIDHDVKSIHHNLKIYTKVMEQYSATCCKITQYFNDLSYEMLVIVAQMKRSEL